MLIYPTISRLKKVPTSLSLVGVSCKFFSCKAQIKQDIISIIWDPCTYSKEQKSYSFYQVLYLIVHEPTVVSLSDFQVDTINNRLLHLTTNIMLNSVMEEKLLHEKIFVTIPLLYVASLSKSDHVVNYINWSVKHFCNECDKLIRNIVFKSLPIDNNKVLDYEYGLLELLFSKLITKTTKSNKLSSLVLLKALVNPTNVFYTYIIDLDKHVCPGLYIQVIRYLKKLVLVYALFTASYSTFISLNIEIEYIDIKIPNYDFVNNTTHSSLANRSLYNKKTCKAIIHILNEISTKLLKGSIAIIKQIT